MKNDQWFEPGDKVMRVKHYSGKGDPSNSWLAPFGKVFCVKSCTALPISKYNIVNFVGIDTQQYGALGFVASNFRKVEEIQLCVKAVEAFKNPKKEQQPA